MIVDENDVLRDEGEAYARKLTEAGVRTTCVRYNGTIHDFMMLNPLRETAAATGAIEQAMAYCARHSALEAGRGGCAAELAGDGRRSAPTDRHRGSRAGSQCQQ